MLFIFLFCVSNSLPKMLSSYVCLHTPRSLRRLHAPSNSKAKNKYDRLILDHQSAFIALKRTLVYLFHTFRGSEGQNLPINPPYKRIGSQKPDCPTQQTINHTTHKTVTEKQQTAHKPFDMQTHKVVIDAIDKHPNRTSPADEERMPPPIVVLRAKSDVDCDDGDFGYSENEDDGHDGEETEDVVITRFVLPQRLEDEQQLNEDYSKGNETGEKDGGRRANIPCLLWNLARNGGCFGRVFPGACVDVAVPGSNVDERKLDA